VVDVQHAFTVDVEDWYHDDATARPVAAGDERVEHNTHALLDLMEAHDVRGTFFVLGEVAERFPGLVRRVSNSGHEVASHGHRHQRVMQLTRREFHDDVQRSLRLLEDVTGRPVDGYRAPYFSIKVDVRWPIEILADLGVRYDSSVLAIDRPPGLELVCPRTPFRHPNGLWEVPVALLPVFRTWHLPLAGGAGLRLLPPRLFYRFVRAFEDEVGAGVFYVHPWELDDHSPVSRAASRWVLRYGRARLGSRLGHLFEQRQFAPVVDVFAQVMG